MEATLITCSVCGHTFDPAQHPACAACPMHQGCQTACCPNCGTTNINPAESKMARWLTSILKGSNHAQRTTSSKQ